MTSLNTADPLLVAPMPDEVSHPERTAIRVVLRYHTTDAVNLDYVAKQAWQYGVEIEHREPRDGLKLEPVGLIDADFWWTDRTERIAGLHDLIVYLRGSAAVAIHGWSLDDKELDWLRANGVLASLRLTEGFVRQIARLAGGSAPAG